MLHPQLRELLEAGRLSITLAQRLGAETMQTQTRIWNDFANRVPIPARLTASMAYPQTPQDEQIRLLPATDFRTLQPDALDEFFVQIPTQTRRDIFRRVYESTHTQEWIDLAETAIPIQTRARLASYYIMHNTADAFLSLLTANARQRIRDFYEQAFNAGRSALERERDALRVELTRRGVTGPGLPVPEGRAYREMLPGPSDDPSETGRIPAPMTEGVVSDLAGAQFDYPVAEESWDIVVDRLTDAADAMPLTPSDDCDRFHVDIEQLRVRAMAQRRLEDANAGVIVGRVEPPTPVAPEPAAENAGRVRHRAARSTDPRPATLEAHAELLREQADAINANTRRGAVRTATEIAAAARARATQANDAHRALIDGTFEPPREQHPVDMARPSGQARTSQQIALESSRRGGRETAFLTDAIRRAMTEGRAVIQVDPTSPSGDEMVVLDPNVRNARPRRPI
jgi:hypothetical protein